MVFQYDSQILLNIEFRELVCPLRDAIACYGCGRCCGRPCGWKPRTASRAWFDITCTLSLNVSFDSLTVWELRMRSESLCDTERVTHIDVIHSLIHLSQLSFCLPTHWFFSCIIFFVILPSNSFSLMTFIRNYFFNARIHLVLVPWDAQRDLLDLIEYLHALVLRMLSENLSEIERVAHTSLLSHTIPSCTHRNSLLAFLLFAFSLAINSWL